jgi:hypothetical protein
MRPDQTGEIGEMSQKVFAPQQQPAKLLFELAHGTRKAGWETLQVSTAQAKFRVSQSARK